jgi:uncharacterized membrane protein
MAFCATCGAQVEGRFCAKCGTPVAAPAAAAPPVGAVPPASAPPYAANAPASAGMSENVASGLAYIMGLITGILFLILEPYNKNRAVRFHAFQSIFLNIAWIVVLIAYGIVSMALTMVLHSFIISGLLGIVSLVVWLGGIAVFLYVMIMAFQGKTVVLPIIGPLAQKQA